MPELIHNIPQAKRVPLKVANVEEILSTQFPPRKLLLSPWLTSQSLSMLYAWRGVGKTHAALNIAWAVASGTGWLTWKAEAPAPVVYIDGEMPALVLQGRLEAILASTTATASPDNLRFITPDLNRDRALPDLSTAAGQEEIDGIIDDAQLIIVDNLSCLCRSGGRENEAESWQTIAEWALRQRAQGRSVLFIHHAGKGGNQRGTSKREDILDNVIALKRPNDYESSEGARFEIHFEKARALFGDSVAPVEARLETDEHGAQIWSAKSVDDCIADQIRELKADGLTQRDIAQELSIGLATVNRHLKKAST
jgi:hypothetical protein